MTLPFIAGHRGFKGKYPENSFFGFEKCFQTGATLIETDVWISSDNVLVVSHDVNTKRIFETQDHQVADYNILQTSYRDILQHLKIIGTNEDLHSFKDLLYWFSSYNKEQSDSKQFNRIMLDVKRPNPAKILKYMLQDMLEVNPDIDYWIDRVQIGIWDLKNIKYLNQEPLFAEAFSKGKKPIDILNISVSWTDSLHYIQYNTYIDQLSKNDGKFRFKITGISLLYLLTWSKDFLTKFMPLVKLNDLKFYSWTINNTFQFDYLWKVGKVYDIKEFGLISDRPDQMVEYKEKHSKDNEQSKLLDANSKIDLSFSQWFTHALFSRFLNKRRVTDEELDFGGFVDEEQVVKLPVGKVAIFIFQLCQKLGIF